MTTVTICAGWGGVAILTPDQIGHVLSVMREYGLKIPEAPAGQAPHVAEGWQSYGADIMLDFDRDPDDDGGDDE